MGDAETTGATTGDIVDVGSGNASRCAVSTDNTGAGTVVPDVRRPKNSAGMATTAMPASTKNHVRCGLSGGAAEMAIDALLLAPDKPATALPVVDAGSLGSGGRGP